MNKLLKGSIAGAAGIALLLGGAGTLAYWNDSATLANAGTVSSGELDISSTTAGAWTGLPTGASISSFKMVPGDAVTYTETFTVKAVGDNIRAELSATVPAATGTGMIVTPTYSVTKSGVTAPLTATAGVYRLDKGTYTVAASIRVEIPFGSATVDNTAQNKSIDLSTAVINVKQVQLP